MLSPTFMFNAQPLPVVGARPVKGYAMSGSKESATIAPPKLERTIEEKRKAEEKRAKSSARTRMDNTNRLYRAAMYGKRNWLTTERVGKLVGVERNTAMHALRRMHEQGLVSRRDVSDRKTKVKFEWRWNS